MDWVMGEGTAVPRSWEYVRHADAQRRELVDRYSPSVPRNDIGYPRVADVPTLMAQYHNSVPDGVGAWLAVNGEVIFGTRPLVRAEGATVEECLRVRYSHKGDALYVILLDTPRARRVTVGDLYAARGTTVRLLGHGGTLGRSQKNRGLEIPFPEDVGRRPALALKVTLVPGLAA